MRVYLELNLVETSTNRPVLNAVTNSILLPVGNQLLQYSSWTPVQYNITNPSYQGFAATEFLPVGDFIVCYRLHELLGDGHNNLAEECERIQVEPLSPPQLVYPANQEAIETSTPVFNWIAPAPLNLFTGIQYELELTEMYSGQTEADAVQQNIPLLIQSGISSTSYPYTAGAPQLETGKKYAWRILAKNNDAIVGRSEAWWFTLKEPGKGIIYSNDQPFVKLKKGDQLSYAIAENELKFEYVNETSDTVWNVKVFDISAANRREITLPLDSTRLQTGVNLVRLPAERMESFTDKHIYLLQLRNSREELWQLKFEYRKKF